MMKIPIKFKRVAAVFDEAAKSRPCEGSSGSEYWPEAETDLSDLVNSFIEEGNDNYNMDDHFDDSEVNESLVSKDVEYDAKDDDDDDDERKEMLQDLLIQCVENNDYGIKQKIYHEIAVALGFFGKFSDGFSSKNDLKHRVMSHLRHKGFDAGLCKSRWAKTGRFPAGTYEYIDVMVGQTRYMVEVFLAGQFEVYRPTAHYTTLLGMIPSILIIDNAQVLRQIMRLMSAAVRKSLKHVGMRVPPWRCNSYLQSKYFSPYKRSINRSELSGLGPDLIKKKKTVKDGFELEGGLFPWVSRYSYCRPVDNYGRSKVSGVRVGLLAAVLQGG